VPFTKYYCETVRSQRGWGVACMRLDSGIKFSLKILISVLCCDVDEICALLTYYAVSCNSCLLTFWDNVSITSWPVNMWPILCPETSVNNYQTTLCNIPEEHKSFSEKSEWNRPLQRPGYGWEDKGKKPPLRNKVWRCVIWRYWIIEIHCFELCYNRSHQARLVQVASNFFAKICLGWGVVNPCD
jgi:hypothetical protein